MKPIEFSDMQALIRFGHGHLKDSVFMLLSIQDRQAAAQWLEQSEVNSAETGSSLPDTATQIAFSVQGLKAMGLPDAWVTQFSSEFTEGMSGDASRSRRLGDIGVNAPEHWQWGHNDQQHNHLLVMLYARKGKLDEHVNQVKTSIFNTAFRVQHTLTTDTLDPLEPFGFIDGISQPDIDWQQNQRTDVHARDGYSNLLAPGEVVLGYANEYGQHTETPKRATEHSAHSHILPTARNSPELCDLGINGSYLVLRQLHQNVCAFWRTSQEHNPSEPEQLASKMVGRHRSGEPLAHISDQDIPGIPASRANNHFTFDTDLAGKQCPVSAHVRRSNPRTGDFPPGVSGVFSRLIRMLGFKRGSEYEDMIASTRFHRILRRGRRFGGPVLEPEQARESPDHECGLYFVSLGSSISRQFEFVQSAWLAGSAFAGTQGQQDPLLGHRQKRFNDTDTDQFRYYTEGNLPSKVSSLPEFVTVSGGGYFFLPGLRAIRYLACIARDADASDSDPASHSEPQTTAASAEDAA